MPLLDAAIAEPSFWNTPEVQPSLLGKAPSNATFGYWKILTPSWIAFRKQNIPGNCNRSHGKSLIRVVISLEARSPLHCEDTPRPSNDIPPCPVPQAQTLNTKSLSEVSEEIDERERSRRMKISKANSGKSPWNKGRKHSAETLQRIKERTWLAMQNPKVKEKLQKTGLLQSEETKKKIAKGVRVVWKKRREILVVQETCYFQWQNSIAEAARGGFAGEEELQWDSYDILNKQLEQEWLESEEKRKLNKIDIKRGPKSLEQRRKIAASVAAKWADPEFRERVRAGMAKFRATTAGEERKKRTKPSSQPRQRREPKEKVIKESVKPIQTVKTLLPGSQKKHTAPSYKDPLSLSKLEMIKNIRAQRGASDMRRNEALERAKLLIVEAEKAVEALEAAAARIPIARASLIESKKLIAEAVQSIQSIENAQVPTTEPSSGLKTFPEQ
ncbi:hypothetical protein Droror1_Dr00006399 [Drosera rotundifolia]